MSKAKKINVGIADDHTLFIQGMTELLEQDDGIRVSLKARNGKELLERLRSRADLPDIILMDLDMPEMDGLQATKIINNEFKDIKVIIISMYDNEQVIYNMIQSGACGFLAKDADIDEVVDAIYYIYEKGFFLDKKTTAIVEKMMEKNRASRQKHLGLTEREEEIIKLVCAQKSLKEIADELCLSHRTIEAYKAAIHEKTNTRNTAGLVLYALTNNLIDHLFSGKS